MPLLWLFSSSCLTDLLWNPFHPNCRYLGAQDHIYGLPEQAIKEISRGLKNNETSIAQEHKNAEK